MRLDRGAGVGFRVDRHLRRPARMARPPHPGVGAGRLVRDDTVGRPRLAGAAGDGLELNCVPPPTPFHDPIHRGGEHAVWI